jgi:hypothetical protein
MSTIKKKSSTDLNQNCKNKLLCVFRFRLQVLIPSWCGSTVGRFREALTYSIPVTSWPHVMLSSSSLTTDWETLVCINSNNLWWMNHLLIILVDIRTWGKMEVIVTWFRDGAGDILYPQILETFLFVYISRNKRTTICQYFSFSQELWKR